MLAIVRKMGKAWDELNLARECAALTYFALFAYSPLLVVLAGIAGIFFGREAAAKALGDRVALLYGQKAATELLGLLDFVHVSQAGALAALIGFVVVFYAAGTLFFHLQAVLDSILHVRVSRHASLLTRVARSIVPFVVVLATGAVYALVLMGQGLVRYLDRTRVGAAIHPGWLGNGIGIFATTLVISFGLLAALYTVLPNGKVPGRSLLLGAGAAAMAFTLGQTGFVWYVSWSSTSAAGAASALVLFLMWVNYSATIVIGGEVLAVAHAESTGGHVTPSTWAVRVRHVIDEPVDQRPAE